jgi:UDP-N-acetyl-D-glucosamine dehydrogenase
MSQATVGIVGLGYVGLALAKSICQNSDTVIGFDVDSIRVSELMSAKSPNESISGEDLYNFIQRDCFRATTDVSQLRGIDTVIIAVPTPLTESGNPDYGHLKSACSAIASELKSDALLINESTSHPGTLRDLIAPLIASKREDSAKDIKFACSPERVNPGDSQFCHANTPRVVSGLDDVAKMRVQEFYQKFVREVFVASTPEVAEMSKLLENSFRLINISFINEISDFCTDKGISAREVIAAASTKPFGFMPFYPGPGVGGHCIPVDPVYLLENARRGGIKLPILEDSIKLNQSRYKTIVEYLERQLNGLSGKKILIEGVTYKSNVRDTRETPATRILSGLKDAGARVSWHDPLVETWDGTDSTPISAETWDAILVLVFHDETNVSELMLNSRKIFDFTGRIPKSGEHVQSL